MMKSGMVFENGASALRRWEKTVFGKYIVCEGPGSGHCLIGNGDETRFPDFGAICSSLQS